MKEQIKNRITNLKPEKIWPLAIVVTGLLLSASITFASFSLTTKREVIIEKPTEAKSVLGIEVSPSATLIPIPNSSIAPSPSAFTGTPSPKPSIKPSPSATSTPIPTSQQSSIPQSTNPIIIQIIATPTPVPSQTPIPSPTLEPSPSPITQKIAVEIKQPDSQINFELEITDGINVCAAMQKAKDEGKINSLTINDKYLESFGTLFIEEINGYRNNWVFTVNGESPVGCSQSILKNNDKLNWEFLNL